MSETPPAPLDPQTKPKPRKDKRLPHFWRAVRFLAPHRRLVIISIACAFLVGLTFTTGLSTMLPILRVLLNGDTVKVWAGRIVAEQRLNVKLADDTESVRVDAVSAGPGADAGIKKGDVLGASAVVGSLADPAKRQAAVSIDGRVVTIALPELKWYYSAFYRTASVIPDNPVAAIAVVFGVMFSLGLIGNFVRFYQEYYSDKAGILAVNDIRRKLYDHVLHIPLGFFGLKGTSDVTSRLE